jgi:signal transduction histidine kinase
MIGATLDITKLKQAEEALRRARDELDLRVQERTAALGKEILQRQQAEGALKEAGRRKDESLAMLAHELRNPLALIRNAAEMLKRLDLREPKLWDVIDRQVAHMTRLVHDLLDVSLITRGQIRLRKQPLELAAVIEQAVEASWPLIEARHHRFTLAIPPEPLYVEGDPTRLAQVLSNLLHNAAKHAGEKACIWLTATRVDGGAMISVKDTGIGIAPEVLPHVFGLFTQGWQTPDRARWSLGVGLSRS